MSELNSIPSTTPIPDDTRLVGQRPSDQGGAAVGFSMTQLIDKVFGGNSGTFTRDTIIALKALRGVPATNGVDEFIGLHPYIEGAPVFAHTVDLWAGIPNRFASAADHAHFKMAIRNPLGPGSGSAAERAQMMYTAGTTGLSSLNIHGYESEIATVELQSEHSIDTTATSVSGSPSFFGTVKLRYTVAHGLTLNQRVLFRVTSAVAGIQASFFSATVTQAPTLVSGLYEVLIQVAGLDTNHWDATKASNRSDQNADWRLLTLSAGEVNSAGKVSLARDTSGPTDQVLVTWSSAHGLNYGDNVVLWIDGAITGITGFWLGFHSGFVAEVVSTTQVRIRIRNQRSQSLRSFSGTATSAVSTWSVFPGTLDPHHEVQPVSNAVMAQRDAVGRTRRLALGDADVIVDDEWVVGVGGPGNEARCRGGDLTVGGLSIHSRRAAMEGGVLFTGDLGSNTQAYIRSIPLGVALGTGDFSVFVRARIRSDVALSSPTGNPTLFSIVGNDSSQNYMGFANNANGNFTIDGAIQGSTVNATTTYSGFATRFDGRVVDLVLVRQAGLLTLYVNGSRFDSTLGPTSDRGNWSWASTAEFRVGGYFINSQNYNSAIHRFAVFNRALSATDVRNLSNHDIAQADRWGSLTPFYSGDYSAGVGSNITATGGSLTGNIDGIGGVDDTLRFTMDSGNSGHQVSLTASLFPPGVRYRLSCDVFIPSGQALINRIDFQTLQGPGQGISLGSVSTTGSWQTVTVEFVPTGSNSCGLTIYGLNNNNYTYTGNGTDVFYVKNLRVQRVGAIIDYDLGIGCGEWFRDRSSNRYNASMVYGASATTNSWRHLIVRREGEISFDVSASGNAQILGGLPTNARIRSVTALAAGSVTLSLGTASGGTQIVNAQALTASRQDVTLAGRFSSNGQLWANLSAGVAVTVTIKYEITD